MATSESPGLTGSSTATDATFKRVDPAEAESPVHVWAAFPGITESKLFHEYITRLTNGRDLRVYITASSETGVGKTTLAFAIAMLWDQHGWTADKATLSPREYSNLYDVVNPGSVLMLDEAEQALDRRRGMSDEVMEVGHDFATKRYRQVFGILTLPTRNWLDKRVSENMADYWIQAEETELGQPKGEATVYRLKDNEHYEQSYQKRTETISWPVMDWHPEFRKLERKKIDRMEGTDQTKYVHRDEVENIKENYWNKATKKTRYHLTKAMVGWGISQTDASEILSIAESIEGVSQQRISDWVNSESFEEVYST